jgi:hypothetical protein
VLKSGGLSGPGERIDLGSRASPKDVDCGNLFVGQVHSVAS